jgi:hypothetical protein
MKDFLIRISVLVALALFGLFIYCVNCHADEIDVPKLVQAIYISEGGALAEYPYGIRSVNFSGVDEAKRICENTVRNNIKRYMKFHDKLDTLEFISFLGDRYCPVNASNDPKGLNKNWKKNVTHWYKKLLTEK